MAPDGHMMKDCPVIATDGKVYALDADGCLIAGDNLTFSTVEGGAIHVRSANTDNI